jgi:hypothetical protein
MAYLSSGGRKSSQGIQENYLAFMSLLNGAIFTSSYALILKLCFQPEQIGSQTPGYVIDGAIPGTSGNH